MVGRRGALGGSCRICGLELLKSPRRTWNDDDLLRDSRLREAFSLEGRRVAETRERPAGDEGALGEI